MEVVEVMRVVGVTLVVTVTKTVVIATFSVSGVRRVWSLSEGRFC